MSQEDIEKTEDGTDESQATTEESVQPSAVAQKSVAEPSKADSEQSEQSSAPEKTEKPKKEKKAKEKGKGKGGEPPNVPPGIVTEYMPDIKKRKRIALYLLIFFIASLLIIGASIVIAHIIVENEHHYTEQAEPPEIVAVSLVSGLNDRYYDGAQIDTSLIRLRVIYDNDTIEMVYVTESMLQAPRAVDEDMIYTCKLMQEVTEDTVEFYIVYKGYEIKKIITVTAR